MRRLNEAYWDKFTTQEKNGKIIRDGLKFEDLIECILQREYGQYWTRTLKSHDNNRDFYLTTSEYTYWAECKNYNKVIALDTIAPTLVMAQIFEVNKLIFFSYSDINFSAKNKIISYGLNTKKEIEFFSGDTLDELIIKHRESLPEDFIPQNEHINNVSPEKPIEYAFYFIQTPILGVTLDDRYMVPISEVEKISYNTVFEIALVCVNNTLETDYQIEIILNKEIGVNNQYFTLVDYEFENSSEFYCSKSLPAASGLLNRYFFKSNCFEPSLKLPVFSVTIKKNEKTVKSFNSEVRDVINQWIGKTILIGEQYRDTIKKMEKCILGNDQLSCFVAYGQSGTGKTRLLTEILDILLKHKYRIVSFIGNEEDSAHTLLKELIYFVFEIPREEILKNLENDIFMQERCDANTPAGIAYSLIRQFSKMHSDSELIKVIEESFDILYEKMSKERIAIVIDNIQFFGNAMIHFLQKYMYYSKHQTRANTSVLVLSINQDYITDKSAQFLNYVEDLSKDRKHIECCKVTGFHDRNHGILFLRELLHTSDESLDPELDMILQKTTLKPYYIYQAIYYLCEEGAIMNVDNEKGYLPCLEKFHDTIDKMPPKINDIVSKRWTLFLENNQLNETEVISIISAIYLFRELSSRIIRMFNFNVDIVKMLCNRSFLKKNENENYCFDHDIIEDFFVKHYDDMGLRVIDCIKKCRAWRSLSAYPFINLYNKLHQKNLTSQKLQDIYKRTLALPIHFKLVVMYFSKFLRIALKRQKYFNDTEQWMSMIFGICNLTKNYIGIKKSESIFEEVNMFLGNEIPEEILLTNSFRNYMNIYSDMLFFQKEHERAVTYLKKIQEVPLHCKNDQVYALKSMIHNRLLINYRELPTSHHRKQAQENLEKAIAYANKIKDNLLRDELTYLNISDEGYNYYCMYDEKEKLLSVWNRCMDYPPERLPQKAMNYYRKRIQINLIEQKYQNVFDTIPEAEEHMEMHHASNTEKLNFSLSFSIYKIMAMILEDPVEHKVLLRNEISHAIELSKMMAKRNLCHLLILKSIVCYYNDDSIGTYYHFKEAYLCYNQQSGALFYHEKKSLLLANIYISYQKYNILYKAKEFLSDDDQKEFDCLDIEITDYEAKGILRTSDKLFNLPCV